MQHIGHQRRILVYDPGEVFDASLYKYLLQEGYQVDRSSDETEARQKAWKRHHFMLILGFDKLGDRQPQWSQLKKFLAQFPPRAYKILQSAAVEQMAKVAGEGLNSRLSAYRTIHFYKTGDLSAIANWINLRDRQKKYNDALRVAEPELGRRTITLPDVVKNLEPGLKDDDIPRRVEEMRELFRENIPSYDALFFERYFWVGRGRLALQAGLSGGAKGRIDKRMLILEWVDPRSDPDGLELEDIPDVLSLRESGDTEQYEMRAYELMHVEEPGQLRSLGDLVRAGNVREAEEYAAKTFDFILNPWDASHHTVGSDMGTLVINRLGLGNPEQLVSRLSITIESLETRLVDHGVRLSRSPQQMSVAVAGHTFKSPDLIELVNRMLRWNPDVWPVSVPGHVSMDSIFVHNHKERNKEEKRVWLSDLNGQGPAPPFWPAVILESELRFGKPAFDPGSLRAYITFEQALSGPAIMPAPKNISAELKAALSLVHAIRSSAQVKTAANLKLYQLGIGYVALSRLDGIDAVRLMSDEQAMTCFQALMTLTILLDSLHNRSVLPKALEPVPVRPKGSMRPAAIVCLDDKRCFAAGSDEFTVQGELEHRFLHYFVQKEGKFVTYAELNENLNLYDKDINVRHLVNNIQSKVKRVRRLLAHICPGWEYFKSRRGGYTRGGYVFKNPPPQEKPPAARKKKTGKGSKKR